MVLVLLLILSYASKRAVCLTYPVLICFQFLLLVRYLDFERTSYTTDKMPGDSRMELKDWGYLTITQVTCLILGIVVQMNSF